MSEADLFSILKDLKDDEFKDFKWFLKMEKVGDIQPIQESDLSNAARRDVVDLIVKKYEAAGAVKVTTSILKKINRNDLVTKLASMASGAEGAGPGGAAGPPAGNGVPADKRLLSVRKEFIARVSEPVVNQLLDELLQHSMISADEMDSIRITASRADKARDVIDMVRRKGSEASSVLITALCEVDPAISRELKLI